jgi:acyl-CoA synthetase (AMP-forming)/AMP-acid ligase II
MAFNFADLLTTIAEEVPDTEALIVGDRRRTYAELEERSCRLANFLLTAGLEVRAERSGLAGHESGQAHVALYLYNGFEYLEGMFGAWKARAASFNVNYRYVEDELLYLFDNSQARAVLYHAEFAPRIAAIRDRLPQLSVLIQVEDDSGEALLPGAVAYEDALAGASPDRPSATPSPDDLYILYTGGTTGMPKGVLWRSDDIFVGAMGGRRQDGSEFSSYAEIAEQARADPGKKSLVGPPLMHGAAQWAACNGMTNGGTAVFPSEVRRFDARDFLETAARERVVGFTIVGDAFARPLIDELRRGDYDLSGLILIGSGGAPLSVANKEALFEQLPHIMIFDGMGSSEAGTQATSVSTRGAASTGRFRAGEGSIVLSEDLTRVLDPSEDEVGWLAMAGRVPLGYLGDAEKTARTFPVIDGVRYSVPGDRAYYHDDGTVELLGRDSACINSGGEKIFAEEVELAIKAHPDVFDAVVAPRPSERWGEEVVAVVALREGLDPDEASLLAGAAERIARYKLPKAFVFTESVQRSPSGKADYRWAREKVLSGA